MIRKYKINKKGEINGGLRDDKNKKILKYDTTTHKKYDEEYVLPSEKPTFDITIGILADTCYLPHFCLVANVVLIDNAEVLEERIEEMDFIVIQSAWWDWKFYEGGRIPRSNDWEWYLNDEFLGKVKKIAKEHKKKIVFFSTEDVHDKWFERFLPIAEIADVIYTLEPNRVKEYKERLKGRKKIKTWSFKCHPKLFTPIGRKEEKDVLFAGSYYTHHKNRFKSYNEILEPIKEFKHDFIARRIQFIPEDEGFNITDGYPYTSMPELYRDYKIGINVASYRDSELFYPNRVPDMAMSKLFIASCQSKALTNQFPDIPQSHSYEEGIEILDKYLNDEILRKNIAQKNWRRAMLEQNMIDFFVSMCNEVGIRLEYEKFPLISIVTPTIRKENFNQVIDNFKRQSYPNKELIICATYRPTKKMKKVCTGNIKFVHVKEANTGKQLNKAIEHAKGKWVSKFDDDNVYMDNFLLDMYLATTQTDAEIVGKNSYFMYFEDIDEVVLRFPNKGEQYTNFVSGSAILFKRDVWEKVKFKPVVVGEDSAFMEDYLKIGGKIYSTDPFNYLYIRKSDKDKHTWKVEDDYLRKNSIKVKKELVEA